MPRGANFVLLALMGSAYERWLPAPDMQSISDAETDILSVDSWIGTPPSRRRGRFAADSTRSGAASAATGGVRRRRVEARGPRAPSILEAPQPNPLATSTEIGYTLPHTGQVRLAIYDVTWRDCGVLVHVVTRPAVGRVFVDEPLRALVDASEDLTAGASTRCRRCEGARVRDYG
jgi:hypothetical protein